MANLMTTSEARRSAPASVSSELTFRGLLPKEALVGLVREQTELLGAVLTRDLADVRVTIEKAADTQPATHRVRVLAEVAGKTRGGCAQHADVEWGVRFAFTDLLRRSLDPTSASSPCAQAA